MGKFNRTGLPFRSIPASQCDSVKLMKDPIVSDLNIETAPACERQCERDCLCTVYRVL